MEKLIKLIQEYGELERKVGYMNALTEANVFYQSDRLIKQCTDKYTELQQHIIKLSKEMLNNEKSI